MGRNLAPAGKSETAVPGASAASPRPSGYLVSLDGWRAVAILAVMVSHDQPWLLLGHSTARYKGFGGFGVQVFFAISGLLITTRILEEERLVGRFDIRRFYVRRLFRIQPAALVYLAVAALVMALGLFPPHWAFWLAALFSFVNFLFHPPGFVTLTGHFWSLAVEEHFYVLLSLTLLWVRRRRLPVLASMSLLALVVSQAQYPVDHGWWSIAHTPRATQWQLSGLLMAALAAVLLQRRWVAAAARRYLHPWVAAAFTVAMVALHNFGGELLEGAPLRLRYLNGQVEFVATYFFILWIVSTVLHPRSWSSRFLESPPLRFIGKISYSLYLWHVLFFQTAFGAPSTGHGWLLDTLSLPGLRYLSAFALAVLSYYAVEKPLVRLGHRLAPAASPGRPELVGLPLETTGPAMLPGTPL